MLSAMVSDDPEDFERRGFRGPHVSTLESGIKGLRIGIVRHFHEDAPLVEDEVLDAMERSLMTLEQLGARLSTVNLADFDVYCSVARQVSWPEEYEEHRAELDAYPDRLTPISRSRLDDGKDVSAADYIHARKQRIALTAQLAEIMQAIDVLVLPTTKTVAQVLGYEHTELGKLELSLTRPFNVTGGPPLAACNGFTSAG